MRLSKIISQHYILLILILLGLVVRILFASLPGFKIDVNSWFAWSMRLSNFNFSGFYSKDIFTDYTPGYLYILSLLGFLKNLLNLQDNLYFLLLKIPAIISELIIGLLVYRETRKYTSEKFAKLALCMVLFNPVLIFNSAIWGQVDSILTLFMLTSVLALKNTRLIFSSMFFGLAILIKPQATALVPLFFLFIIRNFHLQTVLKLLLPGFLIIFFLSFPFFPNQTLINLAQHILNTANEYSFTSVNAYNFWGVVGFWLSDQLLWNNFSYQTWGYILLSSYWIIISYFYIKKKLSIYAVAALATLGFFFLPTRVHERYLYPAIIFLILITAYFKSRLLLVLTIILSLLHLLNLYYVYVYYNEIYFNLPKIFFNPLIYNFLADNSKGLSFVSTIVFILIGISIIKHYAPNSKT